MYYDDSDNDDLKYFDNGDEDDAYDNLSGFFSDIVSSVKTAITAPVTAVKSVASGGSIKSALVTSIKSTLPPEIQSARQLARTRLGSKLRNVANAPNRAAIGTTRGALRGKSFGRTFDQNITQPVGKGLKSPGVVAALNFIPVVGTAVSIAAGIALTLDKMRKQRQQVADDSAEAARMDAEIAALEAQAAEAEANIPVTANSRIGEATAINNASEFNSGSDNENSGITSEKILDADKKVPWGLLTTAGVLFLTFIK